MSMRALSFLIRVSKLCIKPSCEIENNILISLLPMNIPQVQYLQILKLITIKRWKQKMILYSESHNPWKSVYTGSMPKLKLAVNSNDKECFNVDMEVVHWKIKKKQ